MGSDFLTYAAPLRAAVLIAAPELTKVFPVCIPSGVVKCPYAFFMREGATFRAVKAPLPPSTSQVRLSIVTAGYDQGVAITQKVFNALAGALLEHGNYRCGVQVSGSSETYENENFIQELILTLHNNV